jgi:hypothetical protein
MELDGIIYKQSKTYPDIYVSACGKILNVKPIGRVDKRDGYVVVREKRLHQLVVECWGEPRPKGRDWCIDHIDENKTNNKVMFSLIKIHTSCIFLMGMNGGRLSQVLI